MQELSTTEMLFLGFIMLNMLYMYIVGKCKIICTSFRNRQGLLFLSISNQGHIKFIFTDNVHISCLSYNVKKSTKKPPSKLSENEKKQVFLSYSMVFSITFMLILLLFLTVTLHESGTSKAIFWSKTIYNKNLSSQCNLIAQIKPVQDKNVICELKRALYGIKCVLRIFNKHG